MEAFVAASEKSSMDWLSCAWNASEQAAVEIKLKAILLRLITPLEERRCNRREAFKAAPLATKSF